MAEQKVFLTRRILPEGIELLSRDYNIDIWPEELPPPRSEMLRRVKGVDGILCLLSDRIDAELMDAAGPQLKVISNYAVGYDNIDMKAASTLGIAVGNTPGVLTDATADLAFALMLAAARRIVEGDRYAKRGDWKTWGPDLLLGQTLRGTTLGLIGYGRIGQAMAKRAAGFDMRILYYNRAPLDPAISAPGTRVELDTLLRESDYISLHVSLNEGTRRLIDQRAFGLMKSDTILVNTSRGAVIDQDALFDALKEKRICAAALDVTDPEPLPADHPLYTLENLIIVPHIGSANVETRRKMSVMAAQNLIAGLRGERLPFIVNPQIYQP